MTNKEELNKWLEDYKKLVDYLKELNWGIKINKNQCRQAFLNEDYSRCEALKDYRIKIKARKGVVIEALKKCKLFIKTLNKLHSIECSNKIIGDKIEEGKKIIFKYKYKTALSVYQIWKIRNSTIGYNFITINSKMKIAYLDKDFDAIDNLREQKELLIEERKTIHEELRKNKVIVKMMADKLSRDCYE